MNRGALPSDDLAEWRRMGIAYEWKMPSAAWWKRLPIIRHVRAAWIKLQIERWYSVGPGMIGLRTGYDDWVVYGIWAGLEPARAAIAQPSRED